MSTALESIESHDQLVRRTRRCIGQFVSKLLGSPVQGAADGERQEQSDIIVGAFEIAARQLTSVDGTFLNTDYRSGHIDSFRGGTEDLNRRMTARFRNHQEGRGTRSLIAQVNEARRARAARVAARAAAKRAKIQKEGERLDKLAKDWRAQQLKKKKTAAVRRQGNQTIRARPSTSTDALPSTGG